MAEKTRYSDAESEEFRAMIMEKLEILLFLNQLGWDTLIHTPPRVSIRLLAKHC